VSAPTDPVAAKFTAAQLDVPLIARATSRVGFGTGGLLRIGSARERLDILAAARACGITHFDTAPIYGLGEAERSLGRFLRTERASITLTTKFGLRPSPLAARVAPVQRAGRRLLKIFPALRRAAARNSAVLYSAPTYSVSAVRASLDASLRALRTDYVDFFLAHQARVDALPDVEVIGLLQQLQRDGKIRAFGVATESAWLAPVLQQRPQLAAVLQFDTPLAGDDATELKRSTGELIITYGLLSRGIAACRERVPWCGTLDDDTIGGLLLRAAVLTNPRGIVLMQSRSPARIKRNVCSAVSDADDERVGRLLTQLRQGHDR
jgi:D-threo-aldose 1-dehydrogenase